MELFTGGERFSIEVEEDRRPPPKKSKKGTTKNMNQTATEYYSEMLEIQKNLAVLKEKVLKRSERVWRKRDRVEILKEQLLTNRLLKEGGIVPEEMSDDMESEDEDENSSDERNFCFHLLLSKT